MNDVIETADALHASANRLYWNSRDGVDQLATRLGMSRHAFYSSIRPLPAGSDCAGCAQPLLFANRAHRSRGHAHCAHCGATATVEVPAEARSPKPRLSYSTRRKAGMVRRWIRDLSYVPPERAAMIGGAAALGLAAALFAGEAMRH